MDICNIMEEEKFKHNRKSSQSLLALISNTKLHCPWRKAHLHSKVNLGLSKLVQRPSQKFEGTRQVKHLSALQLMRKNQNKVQKNILLHKNVQIRQTSLKKLQSIKQQPIKIKVYCHEAYFTPKGRREIFQRHHYDCEKENSVQRTCLKPQAASLKISHNEPQAYIDKETVKDTRKVRLALSHSAMMNSSQWAGQFSDIKNKISDSSYSRQQLQSYYLALIKFSRGETQKYKLGFETMLNLMDVTSNEKVLTEWFNHFKANPTLDQFILSFNNIVDALLRQKVMDFFEIVFQDCKKVELTRQELTNHLAQRLNRKQAEEIVSQIQENLNWDASRCVPTASVLALCCKNDDFCCFMRQFNILQQQKVKVYACEQL